MTINIYIQVIVITIITATCTVGMLSYVVKKLFETHIEGKLEKVKAEVKVNSDLMQEILSSRLKATSELLSMISKARNICRYCMALVAIYISPQDHKELENYLEPEDRTIEWKDIYKKIVKKKQELEKITNNMRFTIYDNSLFIYPEHYRIIHDSLNLLSRFSNVLYEIDRNVLSDEKYERSILLLARIKDLYNTLDSFYQKVYEESTKMVKSRKFT